MFKRDDDDPLHQQDVNDPLLATETSIEIEPPFNMGRIAVLTGIGFGLLTYEVVAGTMGFAGDQTAEMIAGVVGGSVVGVVTLYLAFAFARLIQRR